MEPQTDTLSDQCAAKYENLTHSQLCQLMKKRKVKRCAQNGTKVSLIKLLVEAAHAVATSQTAEHAVASSKAAEDAVARSNAAEDAVVTNQPMDHGCRQKRQPITIWDRADTLEILYDRVVVFNDHVGEIRGQCGTVVNMTPRLGRGNEQLVYVRMDEKSPDGKQRILLVKKTYFELYTKFSHIPMLD
jgi:hypothetical protein